MRVNADWDGSTNDDTNGDIGSGSKFDGVIKNWLFSKTLKSRTLDA